jgi:hypothetical protein
MTTCPFQEVEIAKRPQEIFLYLPGKIVMPSAS